MGDQRFSKGQQVSAYYQAQHDPEEFRFTAIEEDQPRDAWPFIGRTTGWIDGEVLDDVQGDDWVHVKFSGWFRDPHMGLRDDMARWVPPMLVAPPGGPHGFPNMLTVLVVRWWDYWSGPDWTKAPVDELLKGPGGTDEQIPGQHTVWTLWMREQDNYMEIARDAEAIREQCDAPNVCAWYFLKPSRSLSPEETPGCMCESKFFDMCQRFERARFPGDWPHNPWMHKQIAGRYWQPQLCQQAAFQIPPSARVHYADFKEQGSATAERALQVLAELGRDRDSDLARGAEPRDFRGWVHLGFVGSGDASIAFNGLDSLNRALTRLFEQDKSNATVCLVQQAVPDVVCELRVFCFHDAAGGDGLPTDRVWIRRDAYEEEQAVGPEDRGTVVTDEEALQEFFGGNGGLMDEASSSADRLASRWLLWFNNESSEALPMVRIDILVQLPPSGGVALWTADLGLCGSAMCGLNPSRRTTAVLNRAMVNDDTGRFPRPLPPARE